MDDITVCCNECGTELWSEHGPGPADNEWSGVFLILDSKPFIYVGEQEDYVYERICVACFKEKHNDIAGEAELSALMDQIRFYGKNVRNIEAENFKQPGSKSKHEKYMQLINDLVQKINSRRRFIETCLGKSFEGTHASESFYEVVPPLKVPWAHQK